MSKNKKLERKIIRYYKKCRNLRTVAKELGLEYSKIRLIIDNEIVRLYRKCKSILKVAKFFGIGAETIRQRLIKLNEPISRKRYKCNEDFFSQDTPESFYWALFIAADGEMRIVSADSKTFKITLARKDRKHLEKFKKCVEYTGPIYDYEQYDKRYNKIYYTSTIVISSVQMVNDLKRFGIVPRKSHIYKFPGWLKTHPLVNHAIRGYFDGDGSWTLSGKALSWSVRGTKQCLEAIRYVLFKKCKTSLNLKIHFSKQYILIYSGKFQCCRIRDFLYKDATNNIYLVRKKILAYNVLKGIRNPVIFGRRMTRPVIGIHKKTEKILFLEAMTDGKLHNIGSAGISGCCKKNKKLKKPRYTYKNYTWHYATKKEIEKYLKAKSK